MVKGIQISAGKLAHFLGAKTELDRERVVREFLARRRKKKGGFDHYRPLRNTAFECQTREMEWGQLLGLLRTRYPGAPDYVFTAAAHFVNYAANNPITITKVEFWDRQIGRLKVTVSPHARLDLRDGQHIVNLLCDIPDLTDRRVECLLNLLRNPQLSILGVEHPGVLDVRRERLIFGRALPDDELADAVEHFLHLVRKQSS